jgi:hypothetical protein
MAKKSKKIKYNLGGLLEWKSGKSTSKNKFKSLYNMGGIVTSSADKKKKKKKEITSKEADLKKVLTFLQKNNSNENIQLFNNETANNNKSSFNFRPRLRGAFQGFDINTSGDIGDKVKLRGGFGSNFNTQNPEINYNAGITYQANPSLSLNADIGGNKEGISNYNFGLKWRNKKKPTLKPKDKFYTGGTMRNTNMTSAQVDPEIEVDTEGVEATSNVGNMITSAGSMIGTVNPVAGMAMSAIGPIISSMATPTERPKPIKNSNPYGYKFGGLLNRKKYKFGGKTGIVNDIFSNFGNKGTHTGGEHTHEHEGMIEESQEQDEQYVNPFKGRAENPPRDFTYGSLEPQQPVTGPGSEFGFDPGFAMGGDLNKLSENAVQVEADNPNMTDSVETDSIKLDHNEVVTGSRVFSDSLMNPHTGQSFAKDEEKNQKAKGKLEKLMGKIGEKEYMKNEIKWYNKNSDALFQLQEQLATAKGLRNQDGTPKQGDDMPQAQYGGTGFKLKQTNNVMAGKMKYNNGGNLPLFRKLRKQLGSEFSSFLKHHKLVDPNLRGQHNIEGSSREEIVTNQYGQKEFQNRPTVIVDGVDYNEATNLNMNSAGTFQGYNKLSKSKRKSLLKDLKKFRKLKKMGVLQTPKEDLDQKMKTYMGKSGTLPAQEMEGPENWEGSTGIPNQTIRTIRRGSRDVGSTGTGTPGFRKTMRKIPYNFGGLLKKKIY